MFTTKKILSVPVLAVMCAFVGTFSASAADNCTVVYDCNGGEGGPEYIDEQNRFAVKFGADVCTAPNESQTFDSWKSADTGVVLHGGQLYDCVGDEIKLVAQVKHLKDFGKKSIVHLNMLMIWRMFVCPARRLRVVKNVVIWPDVL